MNELAPAVGEYLPVVGKVPAAIWNAVRDGQPIVLTRDGKPAVVVVDLESYEEIWQGLMDITPQP